MNDRQRLEFMIENTATYLTVLVAQYRTKLGQEKALSLPVRNSLTALSKAIANKEVTA